MLSLDCSASPRQVGTLHFVQEKAWYAHTGANGEPVGGEHKQRWLWGVGNGAILLVARGCSPSGSSIWATSRFPDVGVPCLPWKGFQFNSSHRTRWRSGRANKLCRHRVLRPSPAGAADPASHVNFSFWWGQKRELFKSFYEPQVRLQGKV